MIDEQKPKPPVAREKVWKHVIHGEERIDSYHWLRNRGSEDVLQYLHQENDYTDVIMKPTEKGRERLYGEMVARMKETDLSVPEKMDGFYYYSRTEKGKQYGIHCRKEGSLEAEETVLLDGNELALDQEYFKLGANKVSPDHRYLAYSVDVSGDELFTLFVKDLTTGELLSDRIDDIGYGVEWANDNRTLFYTVRNQAHRPYRVYRHVLGTAAGEDELIFEEPDEAYFVIIYKSKSKAYLFIYLKSSTTSEIRLLDANRPQGTFTLFNPRLHGVEYDVTHHEDTFYIHTNEDAVNFKVMRSPVTRFDKSGWEEFIPHRPEVKIDGLESFRDYLVIYERERGLKTIRYYDFTASVFQPIPFQEPVYTIWPGKNPDYHSRLLRFTYSSLITPRSVYDFDLAGSTRELLKQYEVLGGYDPGQYRTERVLARTSDGAEIPISLAYRKDLKRADGNPLWLHGYGSYGFSSDPYFSSSRLSLIDRGFVYAIAHVRGGGDMGRPWYEAGKLLNKKNTFTDFIACAEHLIEQGFTSKDRLVISGCSAGGLLMGAVVNMRPELFSAVIADVPFVDVINTMLDPSIPLTVHEYEEWGNPNDEEYFRYMLDYSPYDNIGRKEYPPMLVLGGLNDSRVQYWEPAKYTARLREQKTGEHLLLLKTDMSAGHDGASGRYNFLKEIAFKFAFVFHVLGGIEY
ncbi:MAG: S9 family peptidase [bacterium]|nr:S9 family peptidase [bacterium]